ncbi:hypothetical protein W97_08874 [Coniosporium apollinis CBS 100218]|uniref:Uncharacterized protein n=1 Tax=Coniosporium apollinis (strain CBS 100218) TaxID=1168221 RepID=R7Z6J6_CONA1|nr:uncharacterized protein W97_08874 [Coniosporium apollinis CBS 100218]EON69614.1 hypothetical protein W97_08874 [Coniosporium apollinis CBS 100218]
MSFALTRRQLRELGYLIAAGGIALDDDLMAFYIDEMARRAAQRAERRHRRRILRRLMRRIFLAALGTAVTRHQNRQARHGYGR